MHIYSAAQYGEIFLPPLSSVPEAQESCGWQSPRTATLAATGRWERRRSRSLPKAKRAAPACSLGPVYEQQRGYAAVSSGEGVRTAGRVVTQSTPDQPWSPGCPLPPVSVRPLKSALPTMRRQEGEGGLGGEGTWGNSSARLSQQWV